ncbi:MAG: Eco57I restriction-modification methylase domain-containing protein [Acidimicrobiales bacterium]
MSARTTALGGLSTIRTVGSVLPADVLVKVVDGNELPGMSADAYRLELGLSPREAANRAWAVLVPAWRAYRAALDAVAPTDAATGLTRDKWLAVLLRELGFGRVRPTPAGGLSVGDRAFPISHNYDTGSGLDVPLHLLGWNVELDRRTPGVAGAATRAPHAVVQEYLNRADAALWAMVANGRTLRLLRDASTLIGQSYVEFDLQAMFDGEVFSDFVLLFLTCHETRFGVVPADQPPVSGGRAKKRAKAMAAGIDESPDGDAGDDVVSVANAPTDCWLERWRAHAAETGTRALQALSPGVAKAIEALGTGFARQPANTVHARLASQEVRLEDYHHALLRLVYRLLFCFVAEDRDVLLDPTAPPAARQRYAAWFSTDRLREIARRRRGTRHSDMFDAVRIVLSGLGQPQGRPELALPGMGGLFHDGPIDALLADQRLPNDALLEALRHLTVVQPVGGGPKRVIDYRNLGAEELGSVYESLLELIPRYDEANRTFTLLNLAGNDRKTTGSYYTPTSLIDCLLDSALDPLLDEAEKADQPEAALLALTICDPACGSGHFLVAAARRLAARVAKVRADYAEPSPADEQRAMHDVVERCIYGVDLNPLAAELAKVSLWLESVQPGRPLSFLSAHIKVGNSLLGTTPALLAAGIPDAAFKALDGDNNRHVTLLRRRNAAERAGQGDLFNAQTIPVSNQALADRIAALEAAPPVSLVDVQLAEARLGELEQSPELRRARHVADTWCAAFVAVKAPGHPELTHASLRAAATTGPLPTLRGGATDDGPDLTAVNAAEVVADLAAQYRFFHWHLEFPQIFTVPGHGPAATPTGWTGGFSCVLGNPPWEHVELKEQEFFAAREPDVAEASGDERKRLIQALADTNPVLYRAFAAAKRELDDLRQFLAASGRYPLCGRGRINTYAVFAESNRNLLHPDGRLGVILPTGIATDATTQHYFKDLVTKGSLTSLYDFENRRPLFVGVDSRTKFCLLTLSGSARPEPEARFAFFLHHPDALLDADATFTLTPDELLLLNPNTGTCPVFRSRRDAELTLGIYRRVPILIRDGDPDGNPWGLSFMQGLFNMTSDSGLFRTRDQLQADGWSLTGNIFTRPTPIGPPDRMLPLYEAKMVHHYDHRWATYDGTNIRDMTQAEHEDPNAVALPRYWVAEPEVTARLAGRWDKQWLLAWRKICRSTDERTFIPARFPIAAAGDNLLLAMPERSPDLLAVTISSLAFDFVARQMLGGTNYQYFIAKQLPALDPDLFAALCGWEPRIDVATWVRLRGNELVYTAWDASSLFSPVSNRDTPFRYIPDRRRFLRAELDACFFHLYGLSREDTAYVLDTFPIVRRKDEAAFGEYRTKRLILEAYDAMAEAIASGAPYVSPLDPPPGHGPRHESAIGS